jgi:hypothetical protein
MEAVAAVDKCLDLCAEIIDSYEEKGEAIKLFAALDCYNALKNFYNTLQNEPVSY